MDSMVTGLTWWSARVPAGLSAHAERLQWLANQLELLLLAVGKLSVRSASLFCSRPVMI